MSLNVPKQRMNAIVFVTSVARNFALIMLSVLIPRGLRIFVMFPFYCGGSIIMNRCTTKGLSAI